MGTAAVQGDLWSAKAKDWAELHEPAFRPLYEAVLDACAPRPGSTVLDVGCGAGLFCVVAHERRLLPTGLDAAADLLAIAARRLPSARFEQGEMEELPYADGTFDLVTGFNSFQYAASPVRALTEARRVKTPQGRVSIQVWGAAEHCEMAAYFKALGSVLPPPPPGAPGPFALSAPGALESLVRDAGLKPGSSADVDVVFRFPDLAGAVRGLNAAGPAIRAIRHAGEPAVTDAVSRAVAPFRKADGSVELRNRFRYLIAE